jgi:hypothetical protein
METYQLDGTEIKTVEMHRVPCGDLTQTFYHHAVTGELVRSDIDVVVDETFMIGSKAGA